MDVFAPQGQAGSARSTATVQVCSGSINLRGAVKCRAYIHGNKPKVKEAIQVLSRVLVHQKRSSEIHGTWQNDLSWIILETIHAELVSFCLLGDTCAVGKAGL